MELRYYINTTQISEPIGFDDFKTILKRTEQHGVSAESSVGELEFDGVGFGIIQTAYNTDIDTELIFKAEIKCDDNDTVWTTLYTGILDLSTYEETYNDYCGCKVKVGEIGVKTTFNNRVDTVVDLDSLVSLDGDVLSAYSNLRKNTLLTAKPFKYTTLMKSTLESSVLSKAITSTVGLTSTSCFDGVAIAELSGYAERSTPNEFSTFASSHNYQKLDSDLQSLKATGTAKFAVKTSVAITLSKCEVRFYKSSAPTTIIASYEFDKTHPNFTDYINYSVDFDVTATLALNEYFICVVRIETPSNLTVSIKWLPDSTLTLTSAKLGVDSINPVYMLHETFSRISEIISGVTVKSKLYSRANSNVNPYYNEDWFLPSKDELALIRTNLYGFSVGVFNGVFFWSSSEINSTHAWSHNFAANEQRQDGKTSVVNYSALVCAKYTISGAQIYNLRDVGVNGGYVFHVVNNTGSFTYYEYIFEYTNIQWSNNTVLISGTQTAVGTGLSNTTLIANNNSNTSAYKVRTGCGDASLRAIATGEMLRNLIYTDGSTTKLNLSFKDLFKNFNAIDNIGWGFSLENNQLYIRVERMNWFYNSDIIMSINAPANKKRTFNNEIISTNLKIGFDKFVSKDDFNAIDAFHTQREYSTKIKAIDNKLDSICKYIADPYALELTRKLSAVENTKDWKYDENIFILCFLMDRSNYAISLETYNISISPARNALNFNDKFFFSNFNTTKNFFLSGSGNVASENTIFQNVNFFQNKDNANFVKYAENTDINVANSFLKPELITFEYPLTLAEYEAIKAEPYGQIVVDGEACYVQEIIREVMTGMCEFKLIPKF